MILLLIPIVLCVSVGAEKFPRSVAGRVVLGLWWVFTILTTASYTASLAAFLTFSMAQVPINSIYDLAAQSNILPLVKNGTNLYTLFKVRLDVLCRNCCFSVCTRFFFFNLMV